MKHFKPLITQSDFIQQDLGMVYSFFGSEISFQEMAVTDLSTAHKNRISARLKRFQYMNDLYFAGTKILYNPDIYRVLQPLGSSHVCGRIGAIGTYKGKNLGFIIIHNFQISSK
jgi:hypothetical protein